MNNMYLVPIIEALRKKRKVFHSEADFQFALAWEIQRAYPNAEIRLEYPPRNEPNRYIDILVSIQGYVYPIELKYKTKKMSADVDSEQFNLKNHGAQDIGAYDFVKDICRVESFASHLDGFKCGYVIWLTNDPYYWRAPRNSNAGYVEFSVHHGARKSGTMNWGSSVGVGTTKGRENALLLRNEYEIAWWEYSDVGIENGAFRYALLEVMGD